MALILSLFFSLAPAETVQETKTDRYRPRRSELPPMNQVARELVCLQSAAHDKYGHHSLMKEAFTTAMIQVYSQALQNGVDAVQMGPAERAAFYANMIVETKGFTHMSEADTFTDTGIPTMHKNATERCAMMGLVQQLRNQEATRNKPLFPQGRGLLQITHCDGMIATLHYMRTQEWRLNWNTVYPIGQTCTRDDLKTFALAYQRAFRQELDPMHVLENMNLIGAPCTQFISNNGVEKSSEQMTVDLSLGFWRGKCGKKAYTVLRGNADSYCSSTKGSPGQFNADQIASRCLTQCVRGGVDGWEQRHEWFLMAKECNQKMAR